MIINNNKEKEEEEDDVMTQKTKCKKNNKWIYSHAIRSSSLFDHHYDQAQTYERTAVVLTQEREE